VTENRTNLFKVRPARRGDSEHVRTLLSEVGFQIDTQIVTWLISHPEMELLVAADSLDKAIGVLALSHRPQLRFSARIATIDELVVAHSWRRKGVGRELLKRAVDRAKVLGAKRLEIQNMLGQRDPALAFFASCGFEQAEILVFKLKG
jgi:N-acetylglutamate synthase-like GNAT family acetyltransferase